MKNKIPITFIEGINNNFQVNVNKQKKFHVQKWNNPNYPNLPLREISSIKPLIPTISAILGNISVPIIPSFSFHFPPPTNSSDIGQSGFISYDNDYYYIYTSSNLWKRIPIVLINSFNVTIQSDGGIYYDNDYVYILENLDRLPMSLFNII